MTWLGYDRYCTELEAEAGRIADAVYDADLALRVPTCPEWTLVDLVQHVGAAHRWAADMIERRVTAPVRPERADPPPEPDARSAWLLAGARRLNEAVRAAGPQAAVWSWSTDQTAGFWSRRILHDTLVHRFDAEIAVGRAAQREDRSLRGPQSQASHTVAVAPDLAADSVSDLLATFAVIAAREPDHGLRGTGETLHFHATDEGLDSAGEWLVRRTPAGVEWEHGHAKGDVAVRGPAADLILVLSRRVAPHAAQLEVLGDERLFTHWLDNTVF